jgi:hypothetical protein
MDPSPLRRHFPTLVTWCCRLLLLLRAMGRVILSELTIFDATILVAVTAVGVWGAVTYSDVGHGFIADLLAGDEFIELLAAGRDLLLMTVPIAAALTAGFLVVPVRTVRERTRRVSRRPGTALCLTAAAALLGLMVRWSLCAGTGPLADLPL